MDNRRCSQGETHDAKCKISNMWITWGFSIPRVDYYIWGDLEERDIPISDLRFGRRWNPWTGLSRHFDRDAPKAWGRKNRITISKRTRSIVKSKHVYISNNRTSEARNRRNYSVSRTEWGESVSILTRCNNWAARRTATRRRSLRYAHHLAVMHDNHKGRFTLVTLIHAHPYYDTPMMKPVTGLERSC